MNENAENVCVITNDGQTNIAKQNSGLKFAVSGFALVKDSTGWLNSKYTNDASNLKNVTLKDIKDNCTIIFKNVTYSYVAGNLIPDDSQYDYALANPVDYLFNVNNECYVENNVNHLSYEVNFNKSSINITNLSDDVSFDAVILLATPFKNEDVDANVTFTDPQEQILFAIEYFPEDKIKILKNQADNLTMNVEMVFSINEDVIGTTGLDEYNNDGLVQALHLANDATSNSIMSDAEGYATTNNMFVASLTPNSATYDSFAKLNIMSLATNETSAAVPQLMFSLLNEKDKTWDGQRLTFSYTSGSPASLFRICEKPAPNDYRLNFELLGENNLYRNIKGAYSNSFVYSRRNELPDYACNNFFINSNENNIAPSSAYNLSFVNSNNNTIQDLKIDGINVAWVNNVTLYDSDFINIKPLYTYENEDVWNNQTQSYETVSRRYGGDLHNLSVMNCNNIFLKGHTTSAFNGTFIGSNSAKHVFNQNTNNTIQIGNSLGYSEFNKGNLIAIGNGLNYVSGNGDKIIIGHFNRNSTNPNDVLIVGDGFIKDEALSSVSADFSASDKNNKFFSAFSGVGDRNGNWYRHNLLNVNRKGFIGISNYNNPSNSARYGIKGITAYNDGEEYEIPFSAVYAKLNISDYVDEAQQMLNAYDDEITKIAEQVPRNVTTSFNTPEFSLNEINVENNSIVNVINEGDTYASVNFSYKTNDSVTTDTRRLAPYNTLQFLYLSTDNLSGFLKVNS